MGSVLEFIPVSRITLRAEAAEQAEPLRRTLRPQTARLITLCATSEAAAQPA